MDHIPPWAGRPGRPVFASSYPRHNEDDLFAALDLGTNNCRLMVAAQTSGGFRVVDSYSRMVKLGEGLHHTGRLAETAMERTLDALRTCADRVGRRQLKDIRAVATEACRRAENGSVFLDRVRAETGFDIRIISGREEACLAVESCANLIHNPRFGPPRNRALLFDIGGGSTEIAWVRVDPFRQAQELIGYLSLPIGVITLSEQFGPGSSHDAGCYKEMVAYIRQSLQHFESVHRIGPEIRRRQTRFIGTSGTVTTLASLVLNLPRYARAAVDGSLLPSASARRAVRMLQKMGVHGIEKHPCIGPDRALFVLPGCAIFEAIHETWPIEDIIVADRGLRDGMVLRMIRKAGLPPRRYQRSPMLGPIPFQHSIQATGS
ncbi:Ppx/GppA phosphatase family protein [Acetobacter tropicalis]|uniref:Exopolyphosphatase n=1 Tax=Acetobacter senegalensis TaxID=446692 RepID=A0A149U3L4_9PROT|nr:Ppx/GppA phosphatase family protein [Acetobacter senegalensis]KXV60001.1 exopolyphosphatase [Acetobacter senegalensis]MCG4274470.1 Ppx/GppA family phosphatase [Acetobacter senegalensis]MDN7351743.1 Ppx/GppA phosphatase family protein [Acetobacter senegalensis]MDN7356283.1 Ppx/GppA phosphatase family protein [Acetobacter senegalensis]